MLADEPRVNLLDAWSLLAVVYGGGGVGTDLNTIRFVAGFMRQAPIGETELQAALGRLQDAGLVHEHDGRIHPSDPIAAFFRARTHHRGTWHDHADLVRFLEGQAINDCKSVTSPPGEKQ
ncbi:MAG TPA: hypothetical protein VGZ22_00795 [Isosphaeraceae bacterium]|jgi:hypothetical protein|nr:hypothetical protein [Isosphaeraceae bacterium]